MSKQAIFILFLFTFGLQSGLIGQHVEPVQLDQVEVSGKRVLQQTAIEQRRLDTLSLQLTVTEDLGFLLSRSSHVFMKSNSPGGLTTASFRGTAANHTKVLWNGFSVNGSQHGQVDFSLLPVFLMDDIELSLSGASTHYSSGIGGTVAISNRSSFGQGTHFRIFQTIGSFGNFGSFADLSFSGTVFQSRTRIFKRSGKNDFSFFNNAVWPETRMKQKNAEVNDHGFLQEIYLVKGKSRLSFLSWNQWNDRYLPAIMTNMERGGDPTEKQKDFLSRNTFSWNYFWNQGSLLVSSALFIENMTYFLQTTTQEPPYIPVTRINSDNHSLAFMHQMQIKQNLGDQHQLMAHLALDDEWVETNNYSSTAYRKRLSLKLSSSHMLHHQILTRFDLQHDWVDGTSVGLMPSVSFTLKPLPKEDLRLNLSASRKYRLPGMNDLYWYPGGNPELKPEAANVVDFNIVHQFERGKLNIESGFSAYYSVINDWIQWRPTSYRYWIPENIAKVHARGLEWHQRMNYQLGGFQSSLVLNHAYTVTTDESTTAIIGLSSGRQLIYIPRFHGNALLHIEKNKYSIHYQLEYTGSRFTNFSNDDAHYSKLPPYSLHHVGAGIQVLHGLEIQFKVFNLMNKSYQAVMWRPMPGRHFQFSIFFGFKKQPKV